VLNRITTVNVLVSGGLLFDRTVAGTLRGKMKMIKLSNWKFNRTLFYYEGEGEGEGEGDSEGEKTGSPTPTPTTPTPTPTFTQDDVNKFVAEERRRQKKANEATIKQLEDLKKTAQLTAEEKERLETRIEDLKNESLTKEQIAKKEAKKEAERIEREKEQLHKEALKWKSKYEESTIDRELLDAAGTDAYNPTQFLDILRPKTRLVEELDEDNQPTGRWIAKVRLSGKDKDGKAITFDLTPPEAVKQMKEMSDDYGNLFRSGANSGTGGNNNSSVKRSGSPPLGNQAAYLDWRKTQSFARK
jgi:hypothetical protein